MKTADKEKLWDAYRQKKTQETREQLIIEYAQLVKLVAAPSSSAAAAVITLNVDPGS